MSLSCLQYKKKTLSHLGGAGVGGAAGAGARCGAVRAIVCLASCCVCSLVPINNEARLPRILLNKLLLYSSIGHTAIAVGERGDDTALAACTSILYRVCYAPPPMNHQ